MNQEMPRDPPRSTLFPNTTLFRSRVSIGGQFAIELAAAFGAAIIGDAIEAGCGREASGQGGVAGDQIDGGVLAPGSLQTGDDALEDAARAAFHQQDRRCGRLATSEKIAHSFEYSPIGGRTPSSAAGPDPKSVL